MKSNYLAAIVGSLSLSLLVLPVRAQFSASTAVTADTNVNATGTTALAVSVDAVFVGLGAQSGNTSDTVNGVVFSGNPPGDGYTLTGFFNDADQSGVAQQSGMSASFADALSDALINTDSGSATLNGLTIGHTYEAQIFAGETDGSGTEAISDGTNSAILSYGTSVTPSGDEYLTDTFKATATSEDFTFTSSGNVLVNAFNLRDEGVLASPEPSTYAMMLAGLAVLGFCIRRKLA
jgi:hypothetical protein